MSVTVSASALASALRDFESLLGAERVLTSADDLREFRDPFQFATWDDYTGVGGRACRRRSRRSRRSCASPAGTACRCGRTRQGRNNGYGGPAPRVKGSVIVSLRQMNRVLEIDEELGYAVVEPGVRWFDLYEAIQAGGHKLMLSIADVGWGSVIGNTLDHGVTYLPYGVDMGDAVRHGGRARRTARCMRTGMGAMPGNRAWHVYKRGLGPTLDQLFMQSNFGIVTKMGVWLMPQPEVYMPLWLRVWRDDDLAPIDRHAAAR